MSDLRRAHETDSTGPRERRTAVRRAAARAAVSDDSRLAVEIRGLVERGEMDEARERFGDARWRRISGAPSRIAYQYLRDAAEADEAVQDAFVKVFSHITSYREAWPFEVWFTRILINGCLDRRKARARRERWFVPTARSRAADEAARLGGRRRRAIARRRGCWPASGARDWRRRSIGSTAGSGRSSCSVITATARRGKSAR